jgi:hypothetical protein
MVRKQELDGAQAWEVIIEFSPSVKVFLIRFVIALD